MRSLIAASWFASCAAAAAQPAALDLHFTAATQLDAARGQPHDPSRLFYFSLTQPGLAPFPLHAEGDTRFDVFLSRKVPPGEAANDRSLGMRITADHDAPRKDKIVLALAPDTSPWHLTEDAAANRRTLSFDVMLDPSYEKPHAWALHLQIWQCCGGHPPFVMRVEPGPDKAGPIDLLFGCLDDVAEAAPRHHLHELGVVRIERGVWHHIALDLAPQSDASATPGLIAVAFDGVTRFTYNGPWGYAAREHTTSMAVELGIYRQRQATTQTLYFQNLRLSPPSRSG